MHDNDDDDDNNDVHHLCILTSGWLVPRLRARIV